LILYCKAFELFSAGEGDRCSLLSWLLTSASFASSSLVMALSLLIFSLYALSLFLMASSLLLMS
jgi:hypothetical protein